MLISHRIKFIYTKTVKTASTSVESFFERYCMVDGSWAFVGARDEHESAEGVIGYRGRDITGKKWYNHMSAEAIRDLIGRDTWSKYYKFCCVRNPWDKMVSAYYHFHLRLNSIIIESESERIKVFNKWIHENADSLLYDGDKYLIDDVVCVDDFIRYEHLSSDITRVCHKLGISTDIGEIPVMKKGFRHSEIPYQDYYSPEAREIVSDRYWREIELFHYRFDN